MSGTHYLGDVGENSALGSPSNRYFYALRTDEEGNIYFTRADTWISNESIEVNVPGDSNDDWEYFELGVDFFDGKNAETHVKDYPNLKYDQYRFDRRSLYYYINDNGELVVRYNGGYSYPSDV